MFELSPGGADRFPFLHLHHSIPLLYIFICVLTVKIENGIAGGPGRRREGL